MTKMIKTWVNDRWPLLLPEHRHARPEWPWWEAGRLASMYHELTQAHGSKPEVVYDIGAEEGDFPALWSSWGCDVVLFEPNERVWPNIKAIWDANDLRPPLACWPGFAGPETRGFDPEDVWTSSGECARWPLSSYGAVIGDHGFLNLSERPDVPSVTIDRMARNVKPPTAITIDIEGAELLALKGATHTLRTHRPKVWVSIHDDFALDMYGVKRLEVVDYMESFGYEPTFIAQDHEAHWMFLPR